MTAQDHIAAINCALAQISTAHGELALVQKLGEKTVEDLDALNASENPDASEVQILESRLRGLTAQKTRHSEAVYSAETALNTAVDEAFNALSSLALSGPGIDEAAHAILPWCGGSLESARKVAGRLPAFQETTAQVWFLNTRRGKCDPDEIAPALIKFLESLTVQATA